MAQKHVADGMSIDLSEIPPQCEHCILGKQTHSSLPQIREGPRVMRRLERIYVDLTGPQYVTSRSGRRYSMNIIDNFSSYVWSTPLRLKSEAVTVLQAWQQAVENQSDERLKYLVSDGGELVTDEMNAWCSARGIIQMSKCWMSQLSEATKCSIVCKDLSLAVGAVVLS